MEFSSIDPKLSPNLVEDAKERFIRLSCELAVRKDNYHVGSGLGGNTLQLSVLQGWKHQLGNVPSKIDLQNGEIMWDAEFIAYAHMSIIRKKLDRTFGRIVRESKGWLPSRQLMSAVDICDELATLMDLGYVDSHDNRITDAGNKLKEFPPEIVLIAVRTKIGISRLVKYNLDEHPAWRDWLFKINKTVDGK